MPDQPPQQRSSGHDLVRQQLAAYRVGRTPGTPAKTTKPRSRRIDRGAGRDPVPFGAVVGRLAGEQGWQAGVQGGNILEQWSSLCPQFVGRIHPEHFDPATGRLDLRPGSPAYATQLRLLGGQLCKQINDKLGTPTVRTIRILPVGAVDTAAPTPGAESLESLKPEPGPVRTRESASAGYRHNLALHLECKPETPPEDPRIAAARASMDARISDPSRREPRTAFTDGVVETERVTSTAELCDAAEAIEQAALREARAQKAGTAAPVRRAFEVAS